jgi:T4 RnlA family RNA ligase
MITLQQAYDALIDRKEFAVKSTENTICFDYIVILPDTFSVTQAEIEQRSKFYESRGICKNLAEELAREDVENFVRIRRNFRGITFCKHTGELLSLPLHKFYNINQNPESSFDLHKHRSASIYEKLDGSMIHFYICKNGDLKASTCRSSETVQAREASRLVANNPELWKNILNSINAGYTPVFELIAPSNTIVIKYPTTKLIYLISRNRKDGKYLFEECYQDKAKKYDFKLSEVYNHIHHENFEGYVCHLDNGDVFKIKTPWYLERHRAVDAIMKPAYKLYEVALHGVMDDLISLAADVYKPKLQEIYSEVQNDLLARKKSLEILCEELQGDTSIPPEDKRFRKIFAEKAQKTQFFPELMLVFQGKSADALIKKRLLSDYTKRYAHKIWELPEES